MHGRNLGATLIGILADQCAAETEKIGMTAYSLPRCKRGGLHDDMMLGLR